MRSFFALTVMAGVGGCLGPVLQIGDKYVPLKEYNGVKVVDARNSFYKEIHYSTFGFDWDEKDGFLIVPAQNNLNNAFRVSELTRKDALLYHVAWSERGRTEDWRSPKAEAQGKRFFECFKLLPGKRPNRRLFPRPGGLLSVQSHSAEKIKGGHFPF